MAGLPGVELARTEVNGYLSYRAADFASRYIPRRFAYWISLRLADSFYRRDAAGRAAVKANLRQVLTFRGEQPTDELLDSMARQTFQYFGKYLVDFFRFANVPPDRIRRLVSVEHPEYVAEARSSGRGVIAVTAHFGNWEMAGYVLTMMGERMHAVALEQGGEKVNRLFQRYRRKRGMSIIPLNGAARAAMRLLRQGETVALLADRDYGARDGAVSLFGAPAHLPRGPAWLSHRLGAPILPVFLLRREDDTFLMRFHRPIRPEQAGGEEAIQRQLCAILEQEIGARPVQWLMFEDLWGGRAYGRAAETGKGIEA